jgi:DNA-binding HxlR family transcriptional regulator
MNSYKFSIKISDTGTITLPHVPSLYNMEADVFIVPKKKLNRIKPEHKKYSATDFLNEFSGIIKGMEHITDKELDNLKQERLKKKYS